MVSWSGPAEESVPPPRHLALHALALVGSFPGMLYAVFSLDPFGHLDFLFAHLA